MRFHRNYTTEQHKRWWQKRKMDWRAEVNTWNHPHRLLLAGILSKLNWLSLIEIGCGAGANLVCFVKTLPGRQLGGVDMNSEAIQMAEKVLKGGIFKVNSGDDVMVSDDATDIVLTDMALIYVGPWKIKRYLKEIRRIARNYVIICEFMSENWFERQWVRIMDGYHLYDYKKLLTKLGFYDIQSRAIREEDWPGGKMQVKAGRILIAKVPKRK